MRLRYSVVTCRGKNTKATMELKDIVVEARKRLGIKSQKQLAVMVGVSPQAIAGVESGRAKNPRFLPELAVALQMNIDEIRGIDANGEEFSDLDSLMKVIQHSPTNLSELVVAAREVKKAEDELKKPISPKLFAQLLILKSIAKDSPVEAFIEILSPDSLK